MGVVVVQKPRAAVSSDSNGMMKLVMRIKAAGDTVESYICACDMTIALLCETDKCCIHGP